MIAIPELSSSVSAYVQITRSGITANLVQLGTSMITRGYDQNLTLDPGSFSVDLDGNVFNASVSNNWMISLRFLFFFCRIGSINIIVESTVSIVSPIFEEY